MNFYESFIVDSSNTTTTEPVIPQNTTTEPPSSFFGLTGQAKDGLAGGLTGCCILGAGLASGLNLCLMSLDPEAVYTMATNPYESLTVRNAALRVSGILKYQYWVLVTTLIWNALFAETLPLLLVQLVPNPIVVVLISTLAILIFGEVIPQSFFTRYALAVAGFLTPVVWVMMIVSSPISIPIAKLLDCALGHRPQMAMKRVELRELIALNTMLDYGNDDDEHGEGIRLLDDTDGKKHHHHHHHHGGGGKDGNAKHPFHPNFTVDEVALLNGALNLSEKTVRDAMHQGEFIDELFLLEENETLTKEVVESIKKTNKTRIPVYKGDRRNITGFIFSHAILHVLFMAEADAPKIKDCGVTPMARCNAGDLLVVLFKPFLADEQNIAVVHDDNTGMPVGIVTKFDLLSFLFNDDISAEKWSVHDADVLAQQVLDNQRRVARGQSVLMRASQTSKISASLKRHGSLRASTLATPSLNQQQQNNTAANSRYGSHAIANDSFTAAQNNATLSGIPYVPFSPATASVGSPQLFNQQQQQQQNTSFGNYGSTANNNTNNNNNSSSSKKSGGGTGTSNTLQIPESPGAGVVTHHNHNHQHRNNSSARRSSNQSSPLASPTLTTNKKQFLAASSSTTGTGVSQNNLPFGMRREDSFSQNMNRSLSRSSYGGYEYASPTVNRESHFRPSTSVAGGGGDQASNASTKRVLPTFAQQQLMSKSTSSNNSTQKNSPLNNTTAEPVTKRSNTAPETSTLLISKSSTMPNISDVAAAAAQQQQQQHDQQEEEQLQQPQQQRTSSFCSTSVESPQNPSNSTAAPSPSTFAGGISSGGEESSQS